MRTGPSLISVLALAVALAAGPAHGQLDLTPPGVGQQPGARQAPRPARPVVRAPRTAPLPEPRPEEAGEGEAAGAPELATVPPPAATAPTPAPAITPATAASPTPATPAAPSPAATPAPAPSPTPAAAAPLPTDTPPSRIDEAFQQTEATRQRAPAIPETHPAIVNAPLPPTRPGAEPPAPAPAPAAGEIATAVDLPQLEAPFAEAPPRRFEGRAYSDTRYPVGRSAHFATIRRYAEALRVPIDLADAVATVESAYDPHAVGLIDEIGMMQVRPTIARQLGFSGTIQDLFEPETNIRLGITYLAGAWERSGGSLCQALMKYRAGWDETQMSALSLEYCRRAVVHLNAIGSPLARGVTVPPGAATPPPGQRSTSRFNWSDHETRIKQIEQRFGGQNFGIIAGEPRRP